MGVFSIDAQSLSQFFVNTQTTTTSSVLDIEHTFAPRFSTTDTCMRESRAFAVSAGQRTFGTPLFLAGIGVPLDSLRNCIPIISSTTERPT
jgi:hypothetical protein